MFRYTIALPMAFSGQTPTIEVDEQADMPLYKQIMVVLGKDENINIGGGHMHLGTGTQVSGIIVGKQALP